jgi:hypothetical protein
MAQTGYSEIPTGFRVDLGGEVNVERLEAEKVIYPWPSQEPYVGLRSRRFSTASGRAEIYKQSLLDYGAELPFFKEPIEASHLAPNAREALARLLEVEVAPGPAPALRDQDAVGWAQGAGSASVSSTTSSRYRSGISQIPTKPLGTMKESPCSNSNLRPSSRVRIRRPITMWTNSS